MGQKFDQNGSVLFVFESENTTYNLLRVFFPAKAMRLSSKNRNTAAKFDLIIQIMIISESKLIFLFVLELDIGKLLLKAMLLSILIPQQGSSPLAGV